MIPSGNPALDHALLAPRMEQARPPTATRELTEGLARGDDAAWAEFHRSHGPGLFRHLLAHGCGDHDLAAEALQQTYLRIARYARPCDDAPMFARWIRVVAVSVLNDCRRRRRSFWNLLRRPETSRALDDATAPADDERIFSALAVALDQLTPEERALLEDKYFHGADVRRLAAQLALTPKAVESRLTRARAELRRRLLAALSRHE